MSTPGSSKHSAPLIRKLVANSVLPEPAPPQTRVGRPRGNPPLVISSSPGIPVGDFATVRSAALVLNGGCIPGRIAQRHAGLEVNTQAWKLIGRTQQSSPSRCDCQVVKVTIAPTRT